MEEKEGFIARIDRLAEEKGPKMVLLWQFVKFNIVSMLVTLTQLLLVNVLFFALRDFTPPLPGFLNLIFTPATVGEGNNTWGYVLPFLLSNLAANAIGYFLNKSKTFKSDAPLWHFAIYIVVLLILILSMTWLQGVIVHALALSEVEFLMNLAPTIASMAAGTIQFIILFPLQKFVLLREKID